MEAHAQSLMRHLPFLRRYARAMTGSTERGDALVTRCIEDVLKEAEAGAATDRPALYRRLNRLHDAEGAPRLRPQSAHPLEAALDRLAEEERRVFLLVSLEELSLGEAADVMEMPRDRALEALTRAQDAVRDALVADILVVEDDAIIAFDLAETIRNMGHRVCGTAATADEALRLAALERPTLALLDLRLAHGDSGITVARELRARGNLPIIFVTAYAEELRQEGLEHVGPVIRKPFTREQIERAITQAVFTPQADGTPTRTPAG